MNGTQNFREADLILTGDADPCSYGCPHSGCPHEMAAIGRAIAHAIQANTAAVIAAAGHRLDPDGRREWLKATDPDYAAEAEPSFIGGLPEDRITVNAGHELVPADPDVTP